MRLWTGRSNPWENDLSTHLFKTWRWYLFSELTDGQWILSLNTEAEETDGDYSDVLGYYACGLRSSFAFGYECYQYDGFHRMFSLGPLFISWFSDNE